MIDHGITVIFRGESEVIRETGTAAPLDAEAQPDAGFVILGDEFYHLF